MSETRGESHGRRGGKRAEGAEALKDRQRPSTSIVEGLGAVDCSEGCPTAAVRFGVDGIRVLAAERDEVELRLLVETDQLMAGCPRCGVIAVRADGELCRFFGA